MPARTITVFRRLRRVLPVLACAALPAVSHASHEVPVYTVTAAAQTPAALAQALRVALVRATGHRRVATDPALAPLVVAAQRYVLGYLPGRHGSLQVMFDGAQIDQAIRAAGLSVWRPERPFTLVVLNPAPPRSEQDGDATAINQAAAARGLPISIVPLPVRAANGRLLPAQSLLALIHRFSAEQLLIGHPAQNPSGAPASGSGRLASSMPAAPPYGTATSGGAGQSAVWRWTLVTPFMTRRFTGSIGAGVDRTVELLAPPVEATAADRISAVRVRLEGIATLPDYARVETMLAAVPGVERSRVARVAGTTALFHLWARGGAETLGPMLAGSPRFERIGASGGLAFRYVPAEQDLDAAPSPDELDVSR
ncbi:MAG: DUF2066 domain-containing protein [Steroidobacteraceae bacterium]